MKKQAGRGAAMCSSPTRCFTTAAEPSPGLCRHFEADLAFPAEHSTSRVLGHVVRGGEGLAQHWLYSTLSLPALGSGDAGKPSLPPASAQRGHPIFPGDSSAQLVNASL